MSRSNLTRRQFVGLASAGAVVSRSIPAYGNITKKTGKLAMSDVKWGILRV